MRTIIRNNYTPQTRDYCNTIVVDQAAGRRWIFDRDGIFTDIVPGSVGVVVNELGQSTSDATSQKLVTDNVERLDARVDNTYTKEETDQLIEQIDVDLDDYRTAADQDVIDAAQDTAIAAAGDLPRVYNFSLQKDGNISSADLDKPGTLRIVLGDGLTKVSLSSSADMIIGQINAAIATSTRLGSVKIGSGLTVTADGTISTTGGGGGGDVSSVNGVLPDANGEVTITGTNITVDAGTGNTIADELSNQQNAIYAVDSAVVTAQATADSAATAAEGAEALANSAQQEAASAFADAQAALSRADDAYNYAEEAMNMATSAQDAAGSAQTAADVAISDAATAHQAADAASSDAAVAQATADAAQVDATAALADAAEAKVDAAAAITVANAALKTGDNISKLVNDAGYLTAATLPAKYEMVLDNQLDGTAMVFTLSEPVTNETVFYNGVKLRKGLSYTITPTQLTLTLSQAPLAGEILDIEYWK